MVPLDQLVSASLVLQSRGLQVKYYPALSMKTCVIRLIYLTRTQMFYIGGTIYLTLTGLRQIPILFFPRILPHP